MTYLMSTFLKENGHITSYGDLSAYGFSSVTQKDLQADLKTNRACCLDIHTLWPTRETRRETPDRTEATADQGASL